MSEIKVGYTDVFLRNKNKDSVYNYEKWMWASLSWLKSYYHLEYNI